MNRVLLSILLVAATAISGCVSITRFNGQTTRSENQLPEHIKSVAVINRTLPPPGIMYAANKLVNGVIVGHVDRPGVTECINSMCDLLRQKNYFSVSVPAERLRTIQTAFFPPALEKAEVISIGQQFKSDALIVLEIFDAPSTSSLVPGVQMQLDPAGNEYPVNIVTASEKTLVTMGWRVYNTKDGSVIDEYKTTKELESSAVGINEENAKSKLPVLTTALQAAGAELGSAYAHQISPVTAVITRYYYGKTNSQFKLAKQCVKNKNWERAKKIWESMLNDKNPKIAGKAAYNLAVYYERAGNTDKALEMARKANSLCKDDYARNLLYAYGQPY